MKSYSVTFGKLAQKYTTLQVYSFSWEMDPVIFLVGIVQ